MSTICQSITFIHRSALPSNSIFRIKNWNISWSLRFFHVFADASDSWFRFSRFHDAFFLNYDGKHLINLDTDTQRISLNNMTPSQRDTSKPTQTHFTQTHIHTHIAPAHNSMTSTKCLFIFRFRSEIVCRYLSSSSLSPCISVRNDRNRKKFMNCLPGCGFLVSIFSSSFASSRWDHISDTCFVPFAFTAPQRRRNSVVFFFFPRKSNAITIYLLIENIKMTIIHNFKF